MARAKRTQRAEARRRYRATAPGDPAIDEAEGDAPSTTPGRSTSSSAGRTPSTATSSLPAGRMGFGAAFRASIRPVHVRPDLEALPWIAVHTKALWVPVLITVASTVAVIATAGGTLSQFLFQYFIQTPAIGGVFIAGFLAPRASWLLGVIVGLVSAACYSLLVLAYPSLVPLATGVPTADVARDVAIFAFVVSPIAGAFFAAGAAWYRRFLALSSPNRGRPPQGKSAQKARPGDGRTRTATTSQKAGVKR